MMKLSKYLFLTILFCLSLSAYTQIDPSDGCTGVPELLVNATCVSNTYEVDGAYTNGGLVNPSCAFNNNRDDGWFFFVATATSITIEEISTNRDHLIAVYTTCGDGSTEIACDGATEDNLAEINLSGLTVGNTYYLQLQRRSGNGNSDMDGTICIYESPTPDVPWPGLSLGTLSCASTTSISENTSGATTHCSVSSAGDHIYQFTTTQISALTIDLCGASFDTEVHLFQFGHGTCDAPTYASNDDACGTRSSLYVDCLPIGTWVIVIEGSGTATGAYDMDIILNDCGCPTPPVNDDPCNAIELTVGTSCSYTAGTNVNATDSPVANPTCANYNGSDVWYFVTVPAGGWLTFETGAGTITDGGLAIYSGTCASLTQIQCNDDSGPGNMSEIERQDLVPGSTVWIRMWEYGGNFEGTFNICVHEPDCSANITNDFCEDAGVLTVSSSSTFASSTASLYTADNPDNVDGEFCGTLQNNSWYQFVATSTTHSFPITQVIGCTQGIQAEVYEFTGGNGSCCHSFNSVSNCYNPANTTLGTVTATGLTIGETYILMIDGYAGANCDFAISGWTASNILPVEIVEFDVVSNSNHNKIRWKTKSELNSKWFIVERSYDGINYEEIGKLDAAGNSSQEQVYFFNDYDNKHPKLYYRLKEIDYDGTTTLSNSVMIINTDLGFSVYPNPTEGQLTFSTYDVNSEYFEIRYTDASGRFFLETIQVTNGNLIYNSNLLSDVSNGIYFVEIFDDKGNLVYQEKILKTN